MRSASFSLWRPSSPETKRMQMSTTRRRPMHLVRAGIVPLGFLLLAVWISYESLQMPLGTLHMPGAGFFPLVLGLLLGVLALLLSAAERLAAASDDTAAPTDWRGAICL